MDWSRTLDDREPAQPDESLGRGHAGDASDPDDTMVMAGGSFGDRWGTRRLFEVITTFAIVAFVTAFTISQLQPGDIFTSAVPTGGDMGAHVWAPAYLRDHLLPHGRLTGWSMDWYGGLPTYRFYMLPPALMILLLDTVLPYGMAFKIIAVLGIVTLPVCLWAFGKLTRLPYPIPALFAVAGTIFLFDETFTILGGNIASTMAGEFSFSIALSLSVLAFGVFARGLETGRHRGLAAILIALAALSHGVVAIGFVAPGLLLMWLISIDGKRTVYALTSALTGLLLAGFWFFPFILTSKYMTDMKYEGAPIPGGEWNSFWKMFFPHTSDVDRFWAVLAIVGFIAGVVRRNRVVSFLGVFSLVLTAAVFLTKDGIPKFGLLWNVRLLPFMFLLRYLLAMVGIVEIVWGVLRILHNQNVARRVARAYPEPAGLVLVGSLSPVRASARKFFASIAVLGVVGAVGLGWLSWHLGKFPGQTEVTRSGETDSERYRFEWLGIDVATSHKNGFVDGWARHNFTGYEGKGAYGEYKALIETMKGLGADPNHGCGRALWEHTEGEYGTPMALMLLPFWTDSCIGSMEGLFFEASASTPYTFLMKASMSEKASNPVRELTYENKNAELGTRNMQALGVRYYMAFNPATVERADQQADLIKVTTSGPWHIYEVVGSDLVVPLAVEPVVVNERPGDQRERWLEVGASYFQHPERWAAMPTADGPPSWQRVDATTKDSPTDNIVDAVYSEQPIETRPLEPVAVSDVRLGDESISFRVDKTGVPVLVKVSYFPNWEVSGGEGPYRVAPNLMVVVPTSQDVRLTYGRTTIDYGSWLATLLGLLALVWLWRSGPVKYADDIEDDSYPVDPDPFELDDDFGPAIHREDSATAHWTPFDEMRSRPLDDLNVADGDWLGLPPENSFERPDPTSIAATPPPEPPGYGGSSHV